MEAVSINQLVEDNINLVHYCCHKMKVRASEYDDFFQTGCLGLVKAAKNFDFSRGLSFSTYAVPVIFGEIKRVFRDDSPVKMSRSLKSLSRKVTEVSDRLSSELGRSPTVSEIAMKMELTEEEVAEAVCAAQCVVSLTVEGDDGENQFDIPVDSGEEEICNRISLAKTLSSLEEKERDIIIMRYFRHKTQNEIAKILGMTQVQVSRTEKKIISEIRKQLNSENT